MKIAVVHEWLALYAGSERVLEQILLCYPQADLFAVADFLPDEDRGFLRGKVPTTTFVQHLPWAPKRYRAYMPLMPLAVEQLDLSAYDVVISSSHAVAKGILTGPEQFHVSYVHSPMRYAWDLQHQYLRASGLERGPKSWLARWMLHRLRIWDARTANGVDEFVANSAFVARRIWKTYRRKSRVVHPPVDVNRFSMREEKEDFYLAASRMAPYKRMDLVVEAFGAMPDKRLVVMGDGPEMAKVRGKAGGNVEILGHRPSDELKRAMQRAKAFVFAAEEDFGIAPVEAQACGTPVIAYGRGGVAETVRGLGSGDAPTGVFFSKQDVPSIVEAVEKFESNRHRLSPTLCRQNALRFSEERFRKELRSLIEGSWELWKSSRIPTFP